MKIIVLASGSVSVLKGQGIVDWISIPEGASEGFSHPQTEELPRRKPEPRSKCKHA